MEQGSASQSPPQLADTPEPVADLSGRQLGDYRILRCLGQGGMGQVYLAEQVPLKRQVALKILRADLAASPTSLRRFQAEAEAVARVTHANIVQVYAVGDAEGLHFMALEYIDGRNLRDFIAKKGIPDLAIALKWMTQVASALQRAGELGIVHRDIKPENILLTRQGEAKVADFGLSRCLAPGREPLNLTQSGVSLGTPLYMSPEQVQGQEIDPRTDIYSLGVTCYHLLAGHPPFRGQSAFEVAVQHVQNEAEPLAEIRPDLPADLCTMVHKMLAKKPEDRHQSARELLLDLARFHDLNVSDAFIAAGGLAPAATDRPLPGTIYTSPIKPKMPRKRRLMPWFVMSVVLAIGTGIGARYWHDAGRYVAPPPTNSDGSNPVLVQQQAYEQQLKAEVQKPFNPRDFKAIQRHMDHTVELGLLYLEQRRLKEADEYFATLQGNRSKLHQAFGRIGKACVLAFQDQPKASNEQFLAVGAKVVKFADLLSKKGRPMKVVAEYLLLRKPEIRRIIAEALDHNAANLGVETLPDTLESLRHPPVRKFERIRPPGNR